MKTLVFLIQPENFEQEVKAEKKPLLVLCMPQDDQFPEQLKIIEEIATRHSPDLKVGLVQEEFIETFQQNYGFWGTPTFLILVEGKEKGRMLGLADREMLMDLISNYNNPFPDEGVLHF
jgi:hypothetical protein